MFSRWQRELVFCFLRLHLAKSPQKLDNRGYQTQTERNTAMKLLEERIRRDGIVKEGNVLKVDSF